MRKTIRLAALVIVAAFALAASPPPAEALCPKGGLSKVISNVCWTCIFPIKLGTTTIVPSSYNYPDVFPPIGAQTVVCVCSAPPPIYIRIGIVMGEYEIKNLGESVKDPGCMVGLGMQMKLGKSTTKGKANEEEPQKDEESYTWANVHWYKFPLFMMMEMMVDSMCLAPGGFDVMMVSEIDVTHTKESLLALLFPEGVLFGSIPMHMVCMLNAVLEGIFRCPWSSCDLFFWCKGTGDKLYPPGGNMRGTDQVISMSGHVEKYVLKMHRFLMIWHQYSVQGMCYKLPAPIPRKSYWKFQRVMPMKDIHYRTWDELPFMGMYTAGGNMPGKGTDNPVFVGFYYNYCCAW